MSAFFFGSISTLADTSELQREAFNAAFREHGLDWHWDRDDYRAMLQESGGAARIEQYAKSKGQQVDAAAIHASKSRIFQAFLADTRLSPRDGVKQTLAGLRKNGTRVGLVTTTSAENVAALLDALSHELSSADFDVIIDSGQVDRPKPDPAAYSLALAQLGETADHCLAVEDNEGGVQAAKAIGLACVAFPNTNTAGHQFASADSKVDTLQIDQLRHVSAAI